MSGKNISFGQFKDIINSCEVFDENKLLEMYKQYGKSKVNQFFERYFQTLDDEFVSDFVEKFSVYFEKNVYNVDSCNESGKEVSDIVSSILFLASRYPLMSRREENEYGLVLKEGKKNLDIINDDYDVLYPSLNIAKILISISDDDGVKLLSALNKLKYFLGDESILKDYSFIINKYLKLCDFGIPNYSDLVKKFPEVDFNGVYRLSTDDINYQLDLLKNYIIAKFNFYNRNLKLVISIAKKYNYKSVKFEDSIQNGNVGLIKAVNKFDVEKGCKFATYATFWIRQIIARELDDSCEIIRKPVHTHEKIRKYNYFISNYQSINGVYPTDDEITLALGFDKQTIDFIKEVSVDVVSLDSPIKADDSDSELIEGIDSGIEPIDSTVINNVFYEEILSYINNNFTDKEKYVIFERFGVTNFGVCRTLEEVGDDLGITRERVRQIEAKVLRRLRKKWSSIDE